ncbi:FAD/NAD(P)-binding domain-containing protein [Nemania sp. FL0916]|nr:FAD/NAD(P)-binding domain-containing protein [Nemania sp. FL0916]
MPLKILIIGAGICGPALAALLRRADPEHEITVVERAPKLRDNGLQIDLRAQGIPVVRKMGLIDAIRKRVVPESGVSFVDAQGRSFADFGKNDSGSGAQTMTSEYEIMRGDLVDVFYRASLGLDLDKEKPANNGNGEKQDRKDSTAGDSAAIASRPTLPTHSGNVTYLFNTTVLSLTQPSPSSVTAIFSSGNSTSYDVVIGADGQSSRTRRTVLGSTAASEACFHSLDLYMALYQVPRATDADAWMKWHVMDGKRAVMTRSADTGAPTQVYMAVHSSREANGHGIPEAMALAAGTNLGAGMNSGEGGSAVSLQKEAFASAFTDHQQHHSSNFIPPLITALHQTPSAEFYATEIGQVRTNKLSSGRIVLLGDAGYCPSPPTGMGTTLSLVGAYILAGELARHGGGPEDVPAALKRYESAMRPFIDKAQKLPPGIPRAVYAQTRWGVWMLTTFIWLVAKLRVVDLLVKILPENLGGPVIPEYPELHLDP